MRTEYVVGHKTECVVGHKTNNGENNPLSYRWNLASYPQEYKYSSALFYEEGIDTFGLLTHYED
jgi:hypothetical protein